MEIRKLIDHTIKPLPCIYTVAQALRLMEEQKAVVLPVVDEQNNFMGLFHKRTSIEEESEQQLSDFIKRNSNEHEEAIRENEHFYELISKLYELKSPIVPVVDQQGRYLGVVTSERLMHMFSGSFSFVEPGSILLLLIPKTDYSMAEIAQIVESEGGAILSSIIHKSDVPEAVYVTLKINLNNLSSIIQSFERHGYKVESRYSEREYRDVLKDRYDELMNYLDV